MDEKIMVSKLERSPQCKFSDTSESVYQGQTHRMKTNYLLLMKWNNWYH